MKKCHLTIDVKNNSVDMSLKQGEKTVDSLKFGYSRNLDNELISGVDKILKKNRLNISFSGCFLEFGKYPQNSTSSLITKAIAEGIKTRHI